MVLAHHGRGNRAYIAAYAMVARRESKERSGRGRREGRGRENKPRERENKPVLECQR